MVAGPLVLLQYKRFNDVLDGATFGVASGVAFVGAQTLVTALDLFDSGLRPVGEILPWITRLLVLGVAMPVDRGRRHRRPVRRALAAVSGPGPRPGALGPLGQPLVAILVAVAMMLIASLAVLLLPELGTLIVVGGPGRRIACCGCAASSMSGLLQEAG